MEGTNFTLKCMSEHWPNVTNYTWPENAGAVAKKNALIFENVNRTHNGKLVKCLAVSSDGVIVSSDTVKLQVYCEYDFSFSFSRLLITTKHREFLHFTMV